MTNRGDYGRITSCPACGTKNRISGRFDDSVPVCGRCGTPLELDSSELAKPARYLNDLCVLCGRIEGGVNHALSDGRIYHESCYQSRFQRLEELQQTRERMLAEISESKKKVLEAKTVRHRIRVLFGGQETDVESHMSAIETLEGQVSRYSQELNALEVQLRGLWDFWPTYPPDWIVRANIVKSASHGCAECGSLIGLQVHHRKGIAVGGDHRRENLQALCAFCHGRIHGKDFAAKTFEEEAGPSVFSERIELIRRAIRQGASIEFGYRKFDGERSRRAIDPQRIKQVGKSLCVEGFCHLRNATRSFAIQRMRGVRIID